MAKRQSSAETLKRFEGITQVVADSLRFKRKLAIGEDAYASLKVGRALSTAWDVGGVAATGAGVAASSTVAGTFFASSGLLATIGFGAAASTPVGWIVAAAVVTGGAYYGVSRRIGRYARSRVEVIPRFINSPIDELGAALLDMMAALSLKVANVGDVIDPTERAAMCDYFVAEWGYDRAYVVQAVALLEETAFKRPIKEMTTAIGQFVKDHPDCNAPAFKAELIGLLREIAQADGKLDEREEMIIEIIETSMKV